MDNSKDGLLVQLAKRCEAEKLKVLTNKGGIYAIDNECVTPICRVGDVKSSCEMLAELHVEPDGRDCIAFYATFCLDSSNKVRTISFTFEEANYASSVDKKNIQTYGEKVWKNFLELIENQA